MIRTSLRSLSRSIPCSSRPLSLRYSSTTSSGPVTPPHPSNVQSPLSGTPTQPPADKMVHIRNVAAESSEHPQFRTVVWTGRSSQLVWMNVPAGGDIGEEVHHVDQHLFFTAGKAKAVVAGEEKMVEAGDLVIVPQGVKHNFINTGPTPLTLYTVYAPAEHDPQTVHRTKEEGDELEDAGKDEAPKWAQ